MACDNPAHESLFGVSFGILFSRFWRTETRTLAAGFATSSASRIHLRSFLGRNFRTHGNRQEKRNPDGMHHLKATLTKIVSNRDDKERQAEITRLYPAKYRGEDVAIPSDEEDGQQNQPHPAQIQIYFDITVVRLGYSLSD